MPQPGDAPPLLRFWCVLPPASLCFCFSRLSPGTLFRELAKGFWNRLAQSSGQPLAAGLAYGARKAALRCGSPSRAPPPHGIRLRLRLCLEVAGGLFLLFASPLPGFSRSLSLGNPIYASQLITSPISLFRNLINQCSCSSGRKNSHLHQFAYSSGSPRSLPAPAFQTLSPRS